ncbi:MAG: TetR/AcrR family transcriptional regulator [Myxococcales bacterium]|nr:TetR/AcrR family transcriptional regulator [Myxococcales bacterium]MCB9715104.1 TetR/AcrR family transcriptional regulator [Myxococcales bacterium]
MEVLDRAASVLALEGAAALTMRRVAQEVGASTQVLYTLFTSKEGLLDALVEEGFRRFGEALGRVHETDPWAHLRALGLAYRRFALDNPDYYRLLWSGAVGAEPERRPPGGEIAWQALLTAVTRVLAALDRPAREVEPMATAIWSASHGFCSLELAGFPGGDVAHEELMDLCAAGLMGAPAIRRARGA